MLTRPTRNPQALIRDGRIPGLNLARVACIVWPKPMRFKKVLGEEVGLQFGFRVHEVTDPWPHSSERPGRWSRRDLDDEFASVDGGL